MDRHDENAIDHRKSSERLRPSGRRGKEVAATPQQGCSRLRGHIMLYSLHETHLTTPLAPDRRTAHGLA